MTFLDKLKAKADELGLAEKAEHLAEEAKKAAATAKDKAGELADANRDKIAEAADKVGQKINERTDGKYADKIETAKEQVARGVDKVAEGRGSAAGAAGAANTAGSDAGSDAPAPADPVPAHDSVPAHDPDVNFVDPGTPEEMGNEGDPNWPKN